MAPVSILKGACHCGNVTFELHTNKADSDFVPRTCQCGLCKRHGASWISDPEGKASIRYADPSNVNAYRFGTATSDFIVCRECGVLLAALCEIDGTMRGVFTAQSMTDHTFSASAVMTNFDGESVEDRIARRRRTWTREVIVIG